MPIHPTAIVSPKAKVPQAIEIGPYCVIGDDVELGEDCVLMNHVSISGPTVIGKRNLFHPFSCVGGKTQDLKYAGEPTYLEIGDDNDFRECVTINRGTGAGEKTIVGSKNLLQSYAHVAHNCVLGDHCIISSHGTLAGHILMEDYSILSGLSGVHQYCRLGRHSLVGGCTKIVQDVPPFCIADGSPAQIRTINIVGLQRRGFSQEKVILIRKAYKALYNPKLNTSQAVAELEEKWGEIEEIKQLIQFVKTSERGIIR